MMSGSLINTLPQKKCNLAKPAFRLVKSVIEKSSWGIVGWQATQKYIMKKIIFFFAVKIGGQEYLKVHILSDWHKNAF